MHLSLAILSYLMVLKIFHICTVENDDVKEGSEVLYSLNIGQLSNIFLLLQN